jgi:hypothetical protein
MSIRFIAEAFRRGIGEKATCSSATMKYERDVDTGKDRQVLTFYIQLNDGEMIPFTHRIDGRADPVAGASDAARIYLETH